MFAGNRKSPGEVRRVTWEINSDIIGRIIECGETNDDARATTPTARTTTIFYTRQHTLSDLLDWDELVAGSFRRGLADKFDFHADLGLTEFHA